MIRAAAFFRIRTRKSHENRKRNYAQKYVTKTVKTIQKTGTEQKTVDDHGVLRYNL